MLTPSRADARGRTDCDTVQALAFAACDNELTRDEIVAVNRHLADCHTCRDRVVSDATFLRAIRRAASLDTAPQALRDRVAQTLQAHAAENAST